MKKVIVKNCYVKTIIEIINVNNVYWGETDRIKKDIFIDYCAYKQHLLDKKYSELGSLINEICFYYIIKVKNGSINYEKMKKILKAFNVYFESDDVK